MMEMDSPAMRKAKLEIKDEDFKAEVIRLKTKLRARRWWHVLFPWKLMILRRDT
jgi:hypothetical protein